MFTIRLATVVVVAAAAWAVDRAASISAVSSDIFRFLLFCRFQLAFRT